MRWSPTETDRQMLYPRNTCTSGQSSIFAQRKMHEMSRQRNWLWEFSSPPRQDPSIFSRLPLTSRTTPSMIRPVATLQNHSVTRSAHVAELVDAHGSGPCAARCGGSSPSVGTTLPNTQEASISQSAIKIAFHADG